MPGCAKSDLVFRFNNRTHGDPGMRMPRVRLTMRRLMAVVAGVAVALALANGPRQLVAPSDWVDVTVRNVPPGLRRRFGSRMSRGPRPPRRSSSSRSAFQSDRTRRNA
jgi:hypothetical protein